MSFGITGRRLRAGLVIAVVAGVGAYGIGTVLAGPADTTVYACVLNNISQQNVRIVNKNTNCTSNEHALSWNITGPTGATGPTGGTGPGGAVALFRAITSQVPGGWEACLYAYLDGYDVCTDPTAAGYAGADDAILVPEGGALVRDLEVTIPASVQPDVSVVVLDNGSPTAVTCTVATGTTCSFAGPAVSVAAGHFLQVEVTNESDGEGLDESVSASFRY